MPYYLHLHFNPDVNVSQLKPKIMANGSVDYHDLGYVQNVVIRQVIAEFKDISDEKAAVATGLNPKLILQEKTFPAGANTMLNPDNPLQLMSTTNGYAVFNDEEGICVKTSLHIDRDVDLTVGNILFVGDVVVGRNVNSGFEVQAKNILIKGHIEASTITAQESIIAESGVKGQKEAVISAGKSIRLPFCENATLMARENILINGVCMHSNLLVGKQLAVKGRLQGGIVSCHHMVFVEEQLGGSVTTATQIILGRDPFLVDKLYQLEATIEKLSKVMPGLKIRCSKESCPIDVKEKMEQVAKKLAAFERQAQNVRNQIEKTDASRTACLVAPGTIRPGVEINIGDARFQVYEKMNNVRFSFNGDDIVHTSPAMNTK